MGNLFRATGSPSRVTENPSGIDNTTYIMFEASEKNGEISPGRKGDYVSAMELVTYQFLFSKYNFSKMLGSSAVGRC